MQAALRVYKYHYCAPKYCTRVLQGLLVCHVLQGHAYAVVNVKMVDRFQLVQVRAAAAKLSDCVLTMWSLGG